MRSKIEQALRTARNNLDFHIVLKGSGRVFGLQMIGALLTYAALILTARMLSVEQYGIYAFYVSLASYVSIIVGLGLPFAAVRFVAEYSATKEHTKLRQFWIFSRRLTFQTGLCVIVGLGLVLFFLGVRDEGAGLIAPGIALGVIPLLALLRLNGETARVFQLAFAYEGPTRIIRPLVMIATIGGLMLVGYNTTSVHALAAVLIAICIGLIVQSMALKPHIPTMPVAAETVKDRLNWLSVSIPFLAPRAFAIGMVELDIVLVGLFRGPEETAVYQVAARLALIAGFVFSSCISFAAPRIAGLNSIGKRDELEQLLGWLTHMIFWPTAIAGVGLVLIGGPVLEFIGSGYSAGWTILVILTLVTVLNAAAGPVVVLLNMTGHQGICARVFAICILINIALHILLIPRFGGLGAAVSVGASILISRYWLLYYAGRHLNISPSIFGRWLAFKQA